MSATVTAGHAAWAADETATNAAAMYHFNFTVLSSHTFDAKGPILGRNRARFKSLISLRFAELPACKKKPVSDLRQTVGRVHVRLMTGALIHLPDRALEKLWACRMSVQAANLLSNEMSKQLRTFTGTEARHLMRARPKAALSSVNRDEGTPYGSLVNVATTAEGAPIILISTLAWHTQNLARDARGSLLFDDTDGLADPLTGARVTVMGCFEQTDDPEVRRRYLARHPGAALYVDFGDFSFWTLRAHEAHAVAGFGRIETMGADEILLDAAQCAELKEAEIGIVHHMNEDHGDAVSLYAAKLLGQKAGSWEMTSIDPDGFDLSNGEQSFRIAFANPVSTAEQARAALIELAKQVRA